MPLGAFLFSGLLAKNNAGRPGCLTAIIYTGTVMQGRITLCSGTPQSAPFPYTKTKKKRGFRMDDKPRITIEVSGGMVQNVYTTLAIDVEVDILDFDENGCRRENGLGEKEEYLRRVKSEQRQIY
jgi:hypothetical protein